MFKNALWHLIRPWSLAMAATEVILHEILSNGSWRDVSRLHLPSTEDTATYYVYESQPLGSEPVVEVFRKPIGQAQVALLRKSSSLRSCLY